MFCSKRREGGDIAGALPGICNIAKLDWGTTGLQNVITLNEGAGKPGEVRLNPEFLSDPSTPIQPAQEGIAIRTSSLEELVERVEPNDAALKFDCEGCENDLIHGAPNATLSRFSEIALECELESEPYMKWLRNAGFFGSSIH